MKLEDLTNRIISASASLIAIGALATAAYQSKLMRDQAKAQVWPYLIAGNSGNNGYGRIVQNVGLGPAIIGAFEVRVNGHPVESWKEAADSMHVRLSLKGSTSTSFRRGIVAPVGAMIELFTLPDSQDVRTWRAALNANKLETWICFCSLYGDCWTTGEDSFEPAPTKACVDDRTRAFKQ